MKHPSVALVLLALSTAAMAAESAPGSAEIPWQTSYAVASKQAQESEKPLLLKFYTGWCPFCAKMDKTTWVDPSVVAAVKSFVPGKINADTDTVAVNRYKTTGFPTIIVAEPDGDQVIRLEGYKSPEQMTGYLKAFLAHEDALAKSFAALDANKKDVPALLSLGDFYLGAGLDAMAVETFGKAVKLAQGPDSVSAGAGSGLALVRTGDTKKAGKPLEQALAASAGAPPPRLLLALGLRARAEGDAAKEKEWLDKLSSQFPDSPEATEAKAVATN
jgi:thioredoxin-related protein